MHFMRQHCSACVLPSSSSVYPVAMIELLDAETSSAPTQKLLGFGGDFLASLRARRM